MKFFSLIFLLLVFTSSAFSESDLFYNYPNDINAKIVAIKKDFNEKNIEDLYRLFIKHKGVEDIFIAYTLVDIAKNNRDKLNVKIVDLISDFYPKDRDNIRMLLLSSSISNLKGLFKFVNRFTIYYFASIISKMFIFIFFIYSIAGNFYIFKHYHSGMSKIYWYFMLLLFVLMLLFLIFIFQSYMFAILSFLTILIYYGSSFRTKGIVFLTILLFGFLNVVTYSSKRNISEHDQISKRPVEFNSLANAPEISLIKDIKSYRGNSDLFVRKVSEFELNSATYNDAIYKLMKGDVSFFESYIKKNRLQDDPVMLSNYASFLAKNAKFDDYEFVVSKINSISPAMHRVFLSYVVNFNDYSYYPYFKIGNSLYEDTLALDYFKFAIIFAVSLIAFVAALMTPKKLARKICSKCGNIFCGECGDVEDKLICSECKELIFASSDVTPMKVFKKEMDKNKNFKKNYKIYLFLKFLLPGSDSIYNGDILEGVLKLSHFIVVIFFVIAKTDPFIRLDNIGFIHFVQPLIYVIFGSFLLLYFIDIVWRRDVFRW